MTVRTFTARASVRALLGAAALGFATFAVAQEAADKDADQTSEQVDWTALDAEGVHEAREDFMKSMGARLGVLGGMVEGKTEYDAATAQTAAEELAQLAATEDWEAMWPEGTDSMSVEGSRASPMIWENMDDFAEKHQELVDATGALVEVAGTDLDALKAAFGPVGGSCGGCHQTYREPE